MRPRGGLLLRLECSRTARVAFGDCAALPNFGTESLQSAQTYFKTYPRYEGHLGFPACAFALRSALSQLKEEPSAPPKRVRSACLLPQAEAVEWASHYLERGAEALKFKVSPLNSKHVLELCEVLKGACLLRLDGNGSFSAQSLKDFCGALGPRRLSCLEFFEQPLKVGEEEASYDILEAVGCPLALDESLSSAPAKLRGWAEAFPSALWVVKASLWHPLVLENCLPLRLPEHLVFSSALETPVGLLALARLAKAWPSCAVAGLDNGGGILGDFKEGAWHPTIWEEGFQEALWTSLQLT